MDEKLRISEGRYAELQYEALRREIEQAQAEVFKILAGAITVLPFANYLLGEQQTAFHGLLALATPFITITIALQFVSHQNRILRCGQFIREEIEKPSGIRHGWESWLEMPLEVRHLSRRVPGASRILDFGIVIAFTLLFVVYYVYSVFVSKAALEEWGPVAPVVGVWLLVAVGLSAFVAIVLLSWRPYLKGFFRQGAPVEAASGLLVP